MERCFGQRPRWVRTGFSRHRGLTRRHLGSGPAPLASRRGRSPPRRVSLLGSGPLKLASLRGSKQLKAHAPRGRAAPPLARSGSRLRVSAVSLTRLATRSAPTEISTPLADPLVLKPMYPALPSTRRLGISFTLFSRSQAIAPQGAVARQVMGFLSSRLW